MYGGGFEDYGGGSGFGGGGFGGFDPMGGGQDFGGGGFLEGAGSKSAEKKVINS